ncbi:hypothetical protein AZSP09_04440 [Azospira sp. I09]|nr:hypothetical protein AZSP09_04440 [Azospira sp. I09]
MCPGGTAPSLIQTGKTPEAAKAFCPILPKKKDGHLHRTILETRTGRTFPGWQAEDARPSCIAARQGYAVRLTAVLPGAGG